MPVIKASVVQAATAAYGAAESLELTLAKLERFVTTAKERDGSQLILFPEAFIGGYPTGSSFGSVLGSRTKDGREQFLRYAKGAIEVPSEATRRVEAISNRHGAFLVVPVIERDTSSLYCTVIFIHPAKGLLGKRRKIVPTGMERILWGRGQKDTLPLFKETFKSDMDNTETEVKLGAVICWENYMPLLRSYYYSKGIQLYFAPNMDDSPKWESTMVHVAREGRCHVFAACQYAQQKDFPSDHELLLGQARDPEGTVHEGGSMIVSPHGEILAGPLRGGEGVLTAEIDLEEHLMSKFEMDCVGHYSRPDIFELKTHGIPDNRSH